MMVTIYAEKFENDQIFRLLVKESDLKEIVENP